MLYEVITLAAGRVQRIHRRVDAQRGDLPGQHDGRIEMREGGGRRRVGQVVRGDVYRLEGGDGTGRITSYNVCYTKLLRIQSR